ncbi:HIT family protein [Sphingosinicella microcystinivorans]|uniref:Diadenosine tetraphosphate (Ap4A) HIT family hydrolase n=1 Tax=Sphingosinicella microcystinivorans TaxID=335406 RepID=A0AAD1D6Z7_SPHMI|nr:HIT family protein [Sphingosinicella microcystinivorans]RKS91553.1 diadenosine tetraphosphate (Ap4A) HIT family hydrolase [Sphingosinicella microcystinivorans]BBE34533.1 HIT family protein [Sphingosinicella microcystinivorans]
MNGTIHRFGYPATLIAEYDHWVVLLRPAQPTLGSLVLAAKSEATAFADLEPTAYAELANVSRDIEVALRAAVDHTKLNYLMLMMVDPHVHAHVIPRYEGSRSFEGRAFPDAGWPKLPALGEAVDLDAPGIASVSAWLKGLWPAR